MAREIECKKIVLKIGKKTLELTPDQAKELRDVLIQIYPIAEKETIYIPQPYPVYPYTGRWWEIAYTTSDYTVSLNDNEAHDNED